VQEKHLVALEQVAQGAVQSAQTAPLAQVGGDLKVPGEHLVTDSVFEGVA
jgi:hypothetical protein